MTHELTILLSYLRESQSSLAQPSETMMLRPASLQNTLESSELTQNFLALTFSSDIDISKCTVLAFTARKLRLLSQGSVGPSLNGLNKQTLHHSFKILQSL